MFRWVLQGCLLTLLAVTPLGSFEGGYLGFCLVLNTVLLFLDDGEDD